MNPTGTAQISTCWSGEIAPMGCNGYQRHEHNAGGHAHEETTFLACCLVSYSLVCMKMCLYIFFVINKPCN